MTVGSGASEIPSKASPRMSEAQMSQIQDRTIVFPELVAIENSVGERRVVRVVGRNADGRLSSLPHGKKGFVVQVEGPQTRQRYALKICLGDDYPDGTLIDNEVAAAMKLPPDLFARPEFAARLTPADWLPVNSGGWVAFLSPWIDGMTLEQFIADRRPIDPPLVSEIAEQMFSAVLALEQSNLRHDDLHRGNVLLSEVRSPGSSPHAPKRIKVCIVDTGSLKDSQDVGQHKPFTDLTHFADALAQMHNAVWRDRRQIVEYPNFSRLLRALVTQLCDDDAARHFLDPKSVFDAIKELKDSSAFGQSERTSFRPFEALSAEHLSGDQVLASLFVSEFVLYQKIANPEPQILEGPRGCGKSMMFRFLSAPVQIQCTDDPSTLPFIGVYVSCASQLQTQLTPISVSTERLERYGEAAGTLFQLVVVAELLRTLSIVRANDLASERLGITQALTDRVVDRIITIVPELQVLPRPASMDLARALADDLDQARVRLSHAITNKADPPFLLADSFLSEVTDVVARGLLQKHARPLVFLLDDYTEPRIAASIQKRLNSIIFERRHQHRFKIACEYFGVTTSDVHGVRFSEDREYQVVDASHLANPLESSGRVAEDFIAELIDRRLHLANWKGKARELLGRSHFKADVELARHLRSANVGETASKVRDAYSGINTIATMWHGDIATMLHFIREIFEEGKVAENSEGLVSRGHQSAAIIRVSKALGSRVGAYDPYGAQMSRLVTAWCNFARRVLVQGRWLDERGKIPFRLQRLEFSTEKPDAIYDELDALSDKSVPAGKLARELVRRAVVMRAPISRGKEGPHVQTVRWNLRRALLPGFNMPLQRNDEYIDPKLVTGLHSLLTTPSSFFDERLGQYIDNGEEGTTMQLFPEEEKH